MFRIANEFANVFCLERFVNFLLHLEHSTTSKKYDDNDEAIDDGQV